MSQGQGAPVLQASSWTAASSSQALGGGCTTPAARTTRPSPSSLVSSLPGFGAPGASPGARGEAPALGLFRTPKGGSGRPRMPQSLPSGAPGTRREEGARRAAEAEERGGAKTPVAQGWVLARAGVAGRLTLASRGVRRKAAVPAVGAQPGFGVHAASGAQSRPRRAPPGRQAHTRRPERAHPQAPSGRRIRPEPGAHTPRSHPPRPLRDWPGAARPSFAPRRRPDTTESPPSPGEKKADARGLRCVGRSSAWKSRGGS